ncbi:MAG: lipid-A-disaccharide synthase [Coxiellaceae bacterium]|jgi:lipid-A-disaccharide synthase|nr:lipid-A-disaccharide synthase [Coxiellaceae bacterium]
MLTKRVLISAGELSGDMHASNLVQTVTKISPYIRFYGMGSKLMQKAGVDIIVDSSHLSIIGGLEIAVKFIKLASAFLTMRNTIHRNKPDLVVLVDYPGFNLLLAKIAKKAGVKVLYYISPKVWAWNQSRIKTIKKYVDMMAVIFPFEVEFYNKYQIPVQFVGNPLLKMVTPNLSQEVAKQLFNISSKYKTVGLFPGSRLNEIKRLLPIMLKAAKILKEQNPNLQFLLSQAPSITNNDLLPYLHASSIKPRIISGQNYDVMQSCDAIIAVSGTVTLEIALMEIPLIIIYTMSWFEYKFAKRLIKIPYIGLCNILANKKIVPELLQYDATPSKIAEAISNILNDENYRKKMILNLQSIKKTLQNKEQKDISQVIIEILNQAT